MEIFLPFSQRAFTKYRQSSTHSRCSMLLAVGTCALFFIKSAMIGRNKTNHSLEKKKTPFQSSIQTMFSANAVTNNTRNKLKRRLRVRFFGKTRKRIIDPRSLGSRCIKGTKESFPRMDSSNRS